MSDAPLALKANPWKVVDLAELKQAGRLHLPDLQRGFVWSADRVRSLHDSLYRRYPVGAILLWKPTWEGEAPFSTRAWEVFPPHPTTSQGVRESKSEILPGSLFVLDGQQRLTSLFRVIFRSRIRNRTTPDPDLLVSLSSESEWMDDPFHLRSKSLNRKMRDGLLIPAEVLFAKLSGGNESQSVQKAIGEWVTPTDDLFFRALDRANAIRTAILQAEIIAYEIDATAEDDNVIEIFARLNQQGVRLRPSDLAAARLTGQMADFRQRASAVLNGNDLSGFAVPEGKEEGARRGGFVDTDLLIRGALFQGVGLIRYRDVEKSKPEERYAKIEPHWDNVAQAFGKVAAYLRTAGIPSATWLPFRHLMLPLATAVAKGITLDPRWIGWMVLASIWRHYAGTVESKLQKDCQLAAEGNVQAMLDHVKAQAKRADSVVPVIEDFTQSVVNEDGVLLAMLVLFQQSQAKSFVAGKLINSAQEPLEQHHIFPRAMLDAIPDKSNDCFPDRLGNYTLITRMDNESLGDTAPCDYLPTLSAETLAAHMIPNDASLWQADRYVQFCEERERLIGNAVIQLIHELLTHAATDSNSRSTKGNGRRRNGNGKSHE